MATVFQTDPKEPRHVHNFLKKVFALSTQPEWIQQALTPGEQQDINVVPHKHKMNIKDERVSPPPVHNNNNDDNNNNSYFQILSLKALSALRKTT